MKKEFREKTIFATKTPRHKDEYQSLVWLGVFVP
jgi:hypothetical protein